MISQDGPLFYSHLRFQHAIENKLITYVPELGAIFQISLQN